MSCTRSQRGFSLLEALVSLSLFLVIMAAALATYAPSRTLYVRGERRANVQQNARVAMSAMSREIRLAGYFPENLVLPAPATSLENPVRIATDSAFAFYGDPDSSGTSNLVLYCLDGNVLRRSRGAIDAASAYDCSNGEIVAESADGLRFTYYDENDNPVPNPPTTPYQLDGQSPGSIATLDDTSQRSLVRRVVVTLTTREEVPGHGYQDFTMSSNVTLRNVN